MTRLVAPLLITALALAFAPGGASAQTDTDKKPVPAVTDASQKNISIELRDAPIRKALERLFDAVKADFVLEGRIEAGMVTAKVQDKPFETVLKVILESASVPLTYEREGNVYIISVKPAPKPDPAKVAKASEKKPVEIVIDGSPNENNPYTAPAPGYFAPAYYTLAPTNYQIGGISIGQAGSPWGGMGGSPLQFGGGWPTFPGNTFFAPQPGWGGFGMGGFLRFP